MAVVQVPLVTVEQYLARERVAEIKSEYISGEIIAMAGATPEHSALATEVRRVFGNRLIEAGDSCVVFDSDLKVRAEEHGPFFYPDATVVCGEPVFDPDDCLRNPYLIIEVLSDSTADYDRVEKFRHYRRFETLQHYILIAQNRILVEHYARREGFLWDPAGNYTRGDASISLPDMGIDVPVSEVYRRLSF